VGEGGVSDLLSSPPNAPDASAFLITREMSGPHLPECSSTSPAHPPPLQGSHLPPQPAADGVPGALPPAPCPSGRFPCPAPCPLPHSWVRSDRVELLGRSLQPPDGLPAWPSPSEAGSASLRCRAALSERRHAWVQPCPSEGLPSRREPRPPAAAGSGLGEGRPSRFTSSVPLWRRRSN